MKLICLFAFTALVLFTSCDADRNMAKKRWSDGQRNNSDNFNTDSYVSNEKNINGYRGNQSNSDKNDRQTDEKLKSDRMVVYNANLDLTVRKPDSAGKSLAAIAKKYQGFAPTVGTSMAILRVKSEYLNQALDDIGKLGKVSNKTLSADDITDRYYDTKIRLDNARKAREKYLDLMQKAQNVQDMVAIEKELDRLNGEIDLLEGQMNRMQNDVAYSTITIYIHERKQPGPLGYIFIGLYKVIKFLFVIN
jgi:hypothetical protein